MYSRYIQWKNKHTTVSIISNKCVGYNVVISSFRFIDSLKMCVDNEEHAEFFFNQMKIEMYFIYSYVL